MRGGKNSHLQEWLLWNYASKVKGWKDFLRQKFKEFIASRLGLQEILKEIFIEKQININQMWIDIKSTEEGISKNKI